MKMKADDFDVSICYAYILRCNQFQIADAECAQKPLK